MLLFISNCGVGWHSLSISLNALISSNKNFRCWWKNINYWLWLLCDWFIWRKLIIIYLLMKNRLIVHWVFNICNFDIWLNNLLLTGLFLWHFFIFLAGMLVKHIWFFKFFSAIIAFFISTILMYSFMIDSVFIRYEFFWAYCACIITCFGIYFNIIILFWMIKYIFINSLHYFLLLMWKILLDILLLRKFLI